MQYSTSNICILKCVNGLTKVFFHKNIYLIHTEQMHSYKKENKLLKDNFHYTFSKYHLHSFICKISYITYFLKESIKFSFLSIYFKWKELSCVTNVNTVYKRKVFFAKLSFSWQLQLQLNWASLIITSLPAATTTGIVPNS